MAKRTFTKVHNAAADAIYSGYGKYSGPQTGPKVHLPTRQ